jgi:hypothetical protein
VRQRDEFVAQGTIFRRLFEDKFSHVGPDQVEDRFLQPAIVSPAELPHVAWSFSPQRTDILLTPRSSSPFRAINARQPELFE